MTIALTDLSIDPEVAEVSEQLLGALTPDEVERLEANILDDGIRDPIVWWKRDAKNVIVDGAHRYAIAMRHGLAAPLLEYKFESFTDCKIWMLSLALGQRNMSHDAKRHCLGTMKTMLMQKGKSEREAIAETAETAGVSEATVRRSAAYQKAWDSLPVQVTKTIVTMGLDQSEPVIKALASLPPNQQIEITRAARVGQGPLRALLVQAGAIKGKKPPRKNISKGKATATSGGGSDTSHGEVSLTSLTGGDDPIPEAYTPKHSDARYEPTDPCPNCGCHYWVTDIEGDISCDNCLHPFGEPVGDADEPQVSQSSQDEPQNPAGAHSKNIITAEMKKKARAAIGTLLRLLDDLDCQKFHPVLQSITDIFSGKAKP